VRQRNFFDPWGNNIGTVNYSLTTRGFTGHEHYPELKIINMNGRLYDPVIARFFSPDKYVANSSFTQDFNRYSYARNNPLMYTDPSGESIIAAVIVGAVLGATMNVAANASNINSVGQFFAYAGIGALAGAAGAAAGVAAAGYIGVSGFLGGMVSGLAGGATGSFITGAGNSWMQGSSFGKGLLDGFRAGVMGGVAGGFIGGIAGGMNSFHGGAKFFDGEFTIPQVAAGASATMSPAEARKYAQEIFKKLYAEGYDKVLNDRMVKYFAEYLDLANYSTMPHGDFGIDATTHLYISEKGQVLNGYMRGYYGKPDTYSIRIAPGRLSNTTDFLATTGHEIIHAIHYSTQAAVGIKSPELFKFYSEAAASRYSYQVYWNSGRYIDSFNYLRRGTNFPSAWSTLLH